MAAAAPVLLEMSWQAFAGLLHRHRVKWGDGAARTGKKCGSEDRKEDEKFHEVRQVLGTSSKSVCATPAFSLGWKSSDWLDIRHRRTFCLLEMGPSAGHESPEAKVRDGQHDIEILVHIAVMQQVVAIQTAEPPWLLHPASLR